MNCKLFVETTNKGAEFLNEKNGHLFNLISIVEQGKPCKAAYITNTDNTFVLDFKNLIFGEKSIIVDCFVFDVKNKSGGKAVLKLEPI